MLNTNCQFLHAEIMDVLRLFGCEGQDFVHSFSREGDEFINVIRAYGEELTYKNSYPARGETEHKRYAKRYAKLSFYKLLSCKTGLQFPWGALTGIRPTKMAYAEKEEGRQFESLFKSLCVSQANIDITAQVIAGQSPIYAANKGVGEDIFISLPFCPTKCEYCSFITAPYSAVKEYVEDYIDCLVGEIKSLKPILTKVNSIYMGGGTPFCLDERQLTRIYAAINDLCAGGVEFTCEAGRPDTFTEQKLRLSRQAGVNRICVNPQSFSDGTLRAIGRRHTAADTLRAYEMAAKYGFDINIDLIAGLADETVEQFASSLDTAISLSPANITVHSLCLKSGSRLKEQVSRLEGGAIEGMIAYSRGALAAAGYAPYYLYRQKYQAGACENIGWARHGKACVYNVDTMEEICSNVAVGAGAISKRVFGGGARIERLASPKFIPAYMAKTAEIVQRRSELFSVRQ